MPEKVILSVKPHHNIVTFFILSVVTPYVIRKHDQFKISKCRKYSCNESPNSDIKNSHFKWEPYILGSNVLPPQQKFDKMEDSFSCLCICLQIHLSVYKYQSFSAHQSFQTVFPLHFVFPYFDSFRSAQLKTLTSYLRINNVQIFLNYDLTHWGRVTYMRQ